MDAISGEDLLLRLLSAAELRSRVISANIANQNTPGYRRQEVQFESLLSDAMKRGAGAGKVLATISEDTETPARPDGNNVNLEIELNTLRQNRLLFETYASILEGRGNLKRIALDR